MLFERSGWQRQKNGARNCKIKCPFKLFKVEGKERQGWWWKVVGIVQGDPLGVKTSRAEDENWGNFILALSREERV